MRRLTIAGKSRADSTGRLARHRPQPTFCLARMESRCQGREIATIITRPRAWLRVRVQSGSRSHDGVVDFVRDPQTNPSMDHVQAPRRPFQRLRRIRQASRTQYLMEFRLASGTRPRLSSPISWRAGFRARESRSTRHLLKLMNGVTTVRSQPTARRGFAGGRRISSSSGTFTAAMEDDLPQIQRAQGGQRAAARINAGQVLRFDGAGAATGCTVLPLAAPSTKPMLLYLGEPRRREPLGRRRPFRRGDYSGSRWSGSAA